MISCAIMHVLYVLAVQCSSKNLMSDQHSMVAGQVTLWSDKVQAVVK